jgi:hypothetical protein
MANKTYNVGVLSWQPEILLRTRLELNWAPDTSAKLYRTPSPTHRTASTMQPTAHVHFFASQRIAVVCRCAGIPCPVSRGRKECAVRCAGRVLFSMVASCGMRRAGWLVVYRALVSTACLLWYVVCACFPYLARPPVPWLIERVTMRWVGWREMHGCWVPT